MQFLEDRNLTFREAEINRKRNTLPLHNRYWKRPSAARFNCNITPPNARPENGQAERHTTDGGLRSIGFPVAWASSPPGRVIMGAKRVNGLKLSDTKSGSRYLKKKEKAIYLSREQRNNKTLAIQLFGVVLAHFPAFGRPRHTYWYADDRTQATPLTMLL